MIKPLIFMIVGVVCLAIAQILKIHKARRDSCKDN